MTHRATFRPDADQLVWDPLLRLFHWSLLCTCVLAYVTQAEDYELHLFAGYLVLGLVVLRIAWGLVGPVHARFADFLYRPGRVWRYLADAAHLKPRRYLGHNPAGGTMVLLLIACLILVCVSGIALDAAENRAGPLGGTRLFYYGREILWLHIWSTYAGIVLVVVHLLGVAHASLVHRENLTGAMITGRKRPLDG